MTKFKMMPLVAMISAGLMGCGSSSSDGGSAPTPAPSPTDYVSLQFIQKVGKQLSVPSGCTVLSKDTSTTPTELTYAKLASDVRVVAHKANGAIDNNLKLVPNESGVLKIDKHKLEDGGFVSIIDSPSDSKPFYSVMSIQKQFLENQLIQIERNQGNVGCYKYGKELATVSADVAVFTSNLPNGANGFQYLSSQFDSGIVSSNIKNVTTNTNEPVLVKSFLTGTLNGYGFATNLNTNQAQVMLEPLDTTVTWSDGLTGNSRLDSLKIYVAKNNHVNFWTEPAVSTVQPFDITSNEQNWHYSASGMAENWSLKLNGAFSSALDIGLPNTLTVSDIAPVVTNASSKGVIVTSGVASSGRLLIRAKYTQSSGSGSSLKTLEHVVVGESVSGEIIVPDLGFEDLSAVMPESLKTELFDIDELSEKQLQNLLRQYESEDIVAFVIPPSDKELSSYLSQTASFTSLAR
ncbi:hypothetical protein FC652_10870 [Vibrio sp. 05-20-BW147]|uniref:hypothetical protein n=1 Tax=Vibrio sp. 05-20-BW147 TaxID=2575834 RepID=UPI001593D425|nr:hypothetical protein [Vibrio sp. 05-20-BW147]NVC63627.1 hypothetical protein [Vibrio sp. 05-20-BW147]